MSILLINFFIFRDSELYIKYYMNIFQTMVLGVLPFLALIFFNIKIYHRFMVTRGRFDRSNRGSTQVRTNFIKQFQLDYELSCTFQFLWNGIKRILKSHINSFHEQLKFSIDVAGRNYFVFLPNHGKSLKYLGNNVICF